MSKETFERTKSESLSPVLIRLLQGIIFQSDRKLWDTLVVQQHAVRDYFSHIGLQLFLDQQDGFAFLRSARQLDQHDANPDASDTSDESGNGLVRRFPLSFDLTLLCVLLRESLETFDSTTNDDHRLILKRSDIIEMLKVFVGGSTDETKQHKRFDALINKVIDMGFLKEIGTTNESFEVRRVIKAFVDAEKLRDIKKTLQQHVTANGGEKVVH